MANDTHIKISDGNVFITGKTGAGKTVLLNNFIVDLLKNNNANDLNLFLVDVKNIEFHPYEGVSHLVGKKPIYTLEEFKTAVDFLLKEIKLRKKSKLANPRIILIADEFIDFTLEEPALEKKLIKIAQKGNRCGVFLVLSTQNNMRLKHRRKLLKVFPCRVYFKDYFGKKERSLTSDLQPYEYLLVNKNSGQTIRARENIST